MYSKRQAVRNVMAGYHRKPTKPWTPKTPSSGGFSDPFDLSGDWEPVAPPPPPPEPDLHPLWGNRPLTPSEQDDLFQKIEKSITPSTAIGLYSFFEMKPKWFKHSRNYHSAYSKEMSTLPHALVPLAHQAAERAVHASKQEIEDEGDRLDQVSLDLKHQVSSAYQMASHNRQPNTDNLLKQVEAYNRDIKKFRDLSDKYLEAFKAYRGVGDTQASVYPNAPLRSFYFGEVTIDPKRLAPHHAEWYSEGDPLTNKGYGGWRPR